MTRTIDCANCEFSIKKTIGSHYNYCPVCGEKLP